jgi:hypothetical protein
LKCSAREQRFKITKPNPKMAFALSRWAFACRQMAIPDPRLIVRGHTPARPAAFATESQPPGIVCRLRTTGGTL